MDMLTNFIFLTTLASELASLVAVVLSLRFPDRRIWPPSPTRSWGRTLMVSLFHIAAAGVVLLGLLDWDRFVFPCWLRLMVGQPVWLLGISLAGWAFITLGVSATTGGEVTLVSRGPYRFTRNPQYAGFILALAGWTLLSNSPLTLVASLVGILLLVLVPRAEEPWLREKYGVEYEQYRVKVGRFFPNKR
jgi:protein-S-isoprenylcysteine O-methyltransferase Ste14